MKNLFSLTAFISLTTFFCVACSNPLGGKSSDVGSTYQPGLSLSTSGAFTLNIPFTAGTDSSYSFSDANFLQLTGGYVRLKPLAQTDHLSSDFAAGTMNAVVWDASKSAVRLNATTNYAVLDSSWTPEWSHLLGYYKLDESAYAANVQDSSSSTANSGVSYLTNLQLGIPGKLNTSANFSGLSAISLPNLPTSGTSSFTISAWINVGVTGARRSIIAYGNPSDSKAIYFFVNTGGNLELDIAYHAGPIAPATLTDNTWHHVAVVNDAGTFQLYVDGIASGGSVSLSPNITPGFQLIGSDSASFNFVGDIDDLAVWNVALSPADISSVYNSENSGTELNPSSPSWANITSYYKLNDPAGGGSVADSSPGGTNTGTYANVGGFGQTGQLGSAAQFNGTTSYIALPSAIAFASDFTYSAWFKTTSTGAILGNSSQPVGKTGSFYYDALIYVGSDGKLRGGNYNGVSAPPIQSSQIVNDGNWHWAVITGLNGSSQSLYLDGVLLGSSSWASGTTPYFTIGTAYTFGWTAGNGNWFYFDGTIDDVAAWNKSLTASELQTIYQRQSAKYSGQFLSRIMNAGSPQNWTSLSVMTTLPFLKELPTTSDSSSAYASQSSGLENQLVGYWKLDETSGTSFADSSLTNSSASATGGVGYKAGRLGGAISFGGSSDLSAPWGLITGNSARTMSLWFQTSSTANQEFLSWGTSSSNQLSQLGIDSGNIGYLGYSNDLSVPVTTSNYADGKWHHMLLSFDGSNRKLFIDGVKVANDTTALNTGASDIYFAMSVGGANYLTGALDEVAVWSRAVTDGTSSTANEVLEIYRRGANRIKYQIRICSAANCSDQASLAYGGWLGPDNTGLSYFSELQNTTLNNIAAATQPSSLVLSFANFLGLTLGTQQYFQYKAVFESDDQHSLCTYGAPGACSPELVSVSVGPDHFTTTPQAVISLASIGSAYQSINANAFTETLGPDACSAGTKYALSPDGNKFYAWNGSSWALSNDVTTAADAVTTAANISSFSTQVGTGTLQVKSYLQSDGSSPCEVDNILITGQK